jgi:hypothetical protein
LRIYEIGRDYQPAEIDTGETARRFLAWLADAAGPVLTGVIRTWLTLPPDVGGLGALVESDADVVALYAEVAALCRRAAAAPGGRAAQ